MLEGKYQDFYNKISKTIDKNNIFTDKLHTLAYGTDASFYRLVPKIVIKTDTPEQVASILELTNNMELSVTFRAAGTV